MNKTMTALANRSQDSLPLINDLIDEWGFSLENRSPGIAYRNENDEPVTNLDLAAFLTQVWKRRGTINIPSYKRTRGGTKTEGQMVVSSENRHGPVIGMVGNKDLFSFSIRIRDANVMTADEVGLPRTFNIQGIDGDWAGWENIVLQPVGLEQEVFDKLCEGMGKITFDYFIHPLRWTSLFGASFRNAKYAADVRLVDELRFIKSEIKRLRDELDEAPEKKVWPKSSKTGEVTVAKQVWAYNSVINAPDPSGDFTLFPTTLDGLKEALSRKQRLENRQEILRFHVRASEYSWWKHMRKSVPSAEVLNWLSGTYPDATTRPVWAKGKVWEMGYRESPTARSDFARMEMEPEVFYYFRLRKTKQNVTKETAAKLEDI